MNHFPSWHNMAVSQWEIVLNRLLKRLYELHSLSVPMFCVLVFKPYVSGGSQSSSLVSPVGRTWATSLADNSAVALRPFPAGDNGDISFWSFGYMTV